MLPWLCSAMGTNKLKNGETVKHNYPKVRKKRDVSYAMSTKLINAIGTEKLNEILSRYGMYNGAKIMSEMLSQPISPFVVRYVRRYKLKNENEKNEKAVI